MIGTSKGVSRLPGLYQRALEIYNKTAHLHPASAQAEAASKSRKVSAAEQERIQEQIDKLVGQTRKPVTQEDLSYTPKKRGEVLPLVSNLAIGGVLVAALLVAYFLYNRQEKSIATGGATLLSAESKLFAALQQESEAQLQQKDRAILEIQDRLASISREREQLRTGMEAALSTREQELRSGFEQQLAAERERLRAQGLSAAAVEQRLAQTEASLRAAFEAQLAAARRQAEADLAAKEAAIGSLAAQAQRELEQAQGERTRAQAEFERRAAELEGQLAAREQELASDRARVAEELAQLRRQQEEERLVLAQLRSGYDAVRLSLEGGNYPRALDELGKLKAFFDERRVAGLPAVQKRRGIEFFLIGSLEELIQARQSRSGVDTAALIEASALLAAVSDQVKRGDALARAGNLQGARAAYLDALDRIPAVSRGYSQLESMRQAEEAARRAAEKAAEEAAAKRSWNAALRQGNVFYEAGNLRESLERYRQALALILGDEPLSRQVTQNIQDAGYRLLAAEDLASLEGLRTAEERRAGLRARLAELKQQYQAYALLTPDAAASEAGSPESLATLLQAKILVRQILDSEPVRSEHPELAATMERYFTILGTQKESDGRHAALQELDALLGGLESRPEPGIPLGAGAQTAMTSYRRDGEADPLLALLERLETLLK